MTKPNKRWTNFGKQLAKAAEAKGATFNVIQPSKTEHADGSVTLRGTPDRAKNLSDISDAIVALLPNDGKEPVQLDAKQARTLWGYAQQIGIIADELSGKRK